MKIEGGSTTVISTGTKVILLDDDTLEISEAFFSVEDADDNGTVGWSDITTKYSHNPVHNETTTSYAIRHYKLVGGVKTLVLSMNVRTDGFDEPGELGLTIDVCASTIKLYFLVKGT